MGNYMRLNPNMVYIPKDYSFFEEDNDIKDDREINIGGTIPEVHPSGSIYTPSQKWVASTSLTECEVIHFPRIFYSFREKFEDKIHNIDSISYGMENKSASLWIYYLTNRVFTHEDSMYSHIDGRLYRFGINNKDINIILLKEEDYPMECKKIKETFEIDAIPCLILTKRRLDIPGEESEVMIKPEKEEFGILKRGIFAKELCEDTNKLDSLIYDIHHKSKGEKSIPKILSNVKWKTYGEKVYNEAKDIFSL